MPPAACVSNTRRAVQQQGAFDWPFAINILTVHLFMYVSFLFKVGSGAHLGHISHVLLLIATCMLCKGQHAKAINALVVDLLFCITTRKLIKVALYFKLLLYGSIVKHICAR